MHEADRPEDRRLANNPIAIVGLAGLFPLARDVREFWSNVVDAVDCVTEVPATHWRPDDYYAPDPKVPDHTYALRGGFLPPTPFSPMEFGVPPNQLDVTGVVQLLSLLVARDALADAGAPGSGWYDSERTGVVLGVTGPTSLAHPLAARLESPVVREVARAAGLNNDEAASVATAFAEAFPPWEENTFPGLLGNVIAGRIANRLDLGGTNYTVDSACASALTAVRAAIGELLDHRADLMLTGGCDTENTIFSYMCFSKTQALSRTDKISPFDAEADGTLVGEGIGILALKRLADAERDGDRVYAVIRGLGSSSDGRFTSIYAPRAEGQLRALRRAYADAGVSPATVELFEAHATGTAVGDQTELTALSTVLTEAGARPRSAAVGSVKSQIGHTKGAAGAASLIKLSLALRHRLLPPTINVSAPNKVLAAADSPLYANTSTRPWVLDPVLGRRRAAASAMGFGGTNFHVVLEEYAATAGAGDATAATPVAPALHGAARAYLWHAPTPAALGELLRSGGEPNGDDTVPASAARVGFVARTLEDADALRALAVEQLASRPDADAWSHPRGVHYRRAALANPTVGVLFAGQGSQYVGMGGAAAIDVPPVLAAFDAANAHFAGAEPTLARAVFPAPTFDEAEARAAEATLTRTEYAQPAIGALSAGHFQFLRELGLRPSGLLGHSFGELTALWAADAISADDFFRLARARGQAMAPPAADGGTGTGAVGDTGFDPGTMAAVRASRDEVVAALAEHPDVVVCNHNAPDQVVVGGPTAAIEAFVAATGTHGLDARRLPVAAAFHTRLVEHAVDRFAADLAEVTIARPATPVYANTAGADYGPDPVANSQVLAEQLRNPVEFAAGLTALRAAGVDVFVEVGPGQVLTGLVRRTLGDDVVAVAVDAGRGGDGAASLLAAAVRLAVLGVELTGLNRYAAPLAARPEPTGLTVTLTGANHVSESRRQAYRDAVTALAPIAASRQLAAIPAPAPPAVEMPAAAASAVATLVDATPVATPPVRPEPALVPEWTSAPGAMVPAATAATPEPGPVAAFAAGAAGPAGSAAAAAELSTLARDHLALHGQFIEGQLRVAEGLVDLLRQAPGDGVAGQEIGLAAQAVAHQSLATGDAHVRVNEILASLATLAPSGAVATGLSAGGSAAGGLSAGRSGNGLVGDGGPHGDQPSGIGQPPVAASLTHAIPAQAGPSAGGYLNGSSNGHAPSTHPAAGPDPDVAAPTASALESWLPAGATDLLDRPAPASLPTAAAPAVDSATVSAAVAEVVAGKTGYPVDVLDPSMALESDLGVDSIKRVQILGALQDRFPGVPAVGPERLAELRTLADVASFLTDGLGLTAGTPAAVPAAVPPAVAPSSRPVPASPAAGGAGQPRDAADDSAAAAAAVVERMPLALRRIPAADPLDIPFGTGARALIINLGGRAAAASEADDTGDSPASRLARRLEAEGLRVDVVTVGATNLPLDADPGHTSTGLAGWDGGDAEAALAAVEDFTRLDLCLLLVEPTGLDSRAEGALVDQPGAVSATRRLADAVLIAGRLVDALRTTAAAGRRAAFVAVTRLDGALGHRGDAPAAAAMTGGVAGLVKTLVQEAPEIFCRAVDVHPALDAAAFTGAVLREVTDVARDVVEVGVGEDGLRWAPSYLSAGDGSRGQTRPDVVVDGDDRPPVDGSDVLVVTGGARGITARCVEALAVACPAELVLLGRTEQEDDPDWAQGVSDDRLKAALVAATRAAGGALDLPAVDAAARRVTASREVRATLAALASAGASAHYLAVDIADPAATAQALAPWRERATGVVHGAGALADALLADKSPAAVRAVLTPKLAGLSSVLTALRDAPLRHLVLFGSVAGAFGNPGQADYAAANEALTRLAATARRRLDGRVVAVNWGAWDAGMVGADLRELFLARGVTLLEPADAAARFVAELLDGTGRQAAVVVGAASPLTGPADTPMGPAVATAWERRLAASVPFIAHRSLAGLETDPVIDDHQIGPSPVLPATAGLGWLINGVERAVPGLRVVGAEDYEVHKGVVFDGSHRRDYWLDVQPGRPAAADARPGSPARVRAVVRGDGGTALPPSHYAATLLLAPAPLPAPAPTAGAWPPVMPWPPADATDASWVYAEGVLSHGPRLAGIRRILVRERTRLVVECQLAETPLAAGAFAGALHSPGLADVLVAAASLLGRWYLGDMGCLPLGIGRAELFAPLPDDDPFVTVVDDLRPRSSGVTVTVTAYRPDGLVLQRLSEVSLVPTPDMAEHIRAAARRRDARTEA
ncbi:type I polyketide synthase [Pseudofrankia sp. BMG5.36]|uniref:type I polyketide synthase n=1 Tax=Pseudofrankia sp. BMG5.36 TaxID=1834512 RepID=UPI0008DADC93|nr:type I polyketide synthase [Pseudofrankia sp. BMG5.36]OHV45827.1 hypothetical protein BCD48_21770 [Pseudofrankia sp. BMG5.36]